MSDKAAATPTIEDHMRQNASSSGTASSPHHRIGLVVPSFNVTVETEMPALLQRSRHASFSFHSARMRMHTVSPEELRAMNAQRDRCVDENTLLDALGVPVNLPAAGRLLTRDAPAAITSKPSTTNTPATAGAQ
jgi:hypothetical protein